MENVEEFTYLGSTAHVQGNEDHELAGTTGKASAAFNRLGESLEQQETFLEDVNSASTTQMCCQLCCMGARLAI